MTQIAFASDRSLRGRLRDLWLAGAAGTALAAPATAQVVTDGSVGVGGALTGPNYTITQGLGLTNSDGTAVLHSFSQFDLLAGETATFTGAATLQSIIARITGAASSIDGTITHTAGTADLYLINPNGIVFGANAFIDVPGSFHAATADTLNFADGASIPMTATPVGTLSTSAIESFGFFGGGAGAIVINGVAPAPGFDPDLLANVGDSFTLSASSIDASFRMIGAGSSSGVRGELRMTAVGSEAGEVAISGAANPFTGTFDTAFGGTINLNQVQTTETAGTLSYDAYFNAGTTTVAGQTNRLSLITNLSGNTNTLYFGGSDIFLNGMSLERRSSQGVGGAGAQAGALTFELTGAFSMVNSDLFLGEWNPPAYIPAVPLSITATSLTIANSIINSNGGTFDAADIAFDIADSASISNSQISARVTAPGDEPAIYGDAGEISLSVGGLLTLTNSRVDASSMVLENANGGAAGSVIVSAGSLQADGGVFVADAFSFGRDAGSVTLTTVGDMAMDNVSFFGARSIDFSSSGLSTGGNGGTFTANIGGDLTMANNSQFVVSGYNGGSMDVTIAGDATLNGSGFYANALESSGSVQAGPAGLINVDVGGVLRLEANTTVSASSRPLDDDVGALAGTIELSANQIEIDDSFIFADSRSLSRRAGTVELSATTDISLTNTATLSAGNRDNAFLTSRGSRGGQIILNAGQSILQTGASDMYAYGYNGGEVSISAGTDYTIAGSQILAGAYDSTGETSAGPAGSVAINVAGAFSLSNARIDGGSAVSAPDPGGDAGAVTINAGSISAASSTISAGAENATGRDGGSLEIAADSQIDLFDTALNVDGQFNGVGSGGSIRLVSDGDIDVEGGAPFARAVGFNGGDIYIRADGLFSLAGTDLEAWAGGQGGAGGDIVVLANRFELVDDADIFADATSGPSGNILIRANSILVDPGVNDGPFGDESAQVSRIWIGGVSGGRLVLEANDITLTGGFSLESLHVGGAGRGGEIVLRANTLTITDGGLLLSDGTPAGRIRASSDAGAAGDIRIEALDFFMEGGSISTLGPAGGTIRIGIDRTFAFTGGNLFTDIDEEGDDRTDGDVYIGFSFAGFEPTNPICDAQCQDWPVFVPGPAPGAGGIPVTFTDESDLLEAQGAVGQVIFGWSRNAFEPILAETGEMSRTADPASAGDADDSETQGFSYATATSREPASLCAVEDERRAGRSALTELLTNVEPDSPLNLVPAGYDDADLRQEASARSAADDCTSPPGAVTATQRVN